MFFRRCYQTDGMSVVCSQGILDIIWHVLTSNVIHDIGSSSGMLVLFTSFRVEASSSNSTVKIAPGGVHVPIIRWCFIFSTNELTYSEEYVTWL